MMEALEDELFEQEPLESDLNAEAEADDLDDWEEPDDYDGDDWSEQDERDYLAERQAEYDEQWGDAVEFPSFANY